ncbi:MAG TPA: MBL fold metallo-hydrolase [Steroidobacteraceae bacterium]|nr:MBL fold metallo-hydrolase [Steroidobacteraceae bacterium]
MNQALKSCLLRWVMAGSVASAAATAVVAATPPPGTLEAATAALGADHLRSITFSGTGAWYQFGQEPNPNAPPPQFEVTRYVASIDYDSASAHIERTTRQVTDPTRWRPVPQMAAEHGGAMAQEFVAGGVAWILGAPGGPATGLGVTAIPDAKNAEERTMEIWATPQGFLRAAAAASHAASRPINGGGTEVSFLLGRHRVVGRINARNEVYSVHYWIDNPVLGDMLCEAGFTEYRDFGGLRFPTHIVRTQGGKLRLDLTVAQVKANPALSLPVPAGMREAMTAPVRVTVDQLAEGVYWLRGFQWHSVAVEQGDHIVMIDAPLDEARSLAVIAKTKETIPGKRITYLINTHAHFDHAGGVRTYVAEGATIVTLPMNQTFFERAWRAPHTLNPDRLERSRQTAQFLPVTNGMLVLGDARRPVEIYEQVGTAHSDAIVMVYLPMEKILVQADAWNTEALTAPRIDTIGGEYVNPYMLNLYDNIMRLNLDVRMLVPLHGPRTTTMAELRQALLLE